MNDTLDWITLTESSTDTDLLEVDCFEPQQKTKPLLAAQNTVEDICNNYPGPFYLLCTGGIDSQSVIGCWTDFATSEALAKTTVISFVYNEQTNWFDVHNLKDICETAKLPLKFIDFDLMDFIESGECLETQKRYKTYSPQMAAHIKMFEQFESGTCIMSGNLELSLNLGLSPEHYSVVRYAKETNSLSEDRKIVPFFFIHDSQIGSSVSTKDRLKINNKAKSDFSHLDSGYAVKCAMYQFYGFRIQPQTKKYSGFEKFKDFYELSHVATPLEKLLTNGKPSKRVFDIHHRYAVESVVQQRNKIDIRRHTL